MTGPSSNEVASIRLCLGYPERFRTISLALIGQAVPSTLRLKVQADGRDQPTIANHRRRDCHPKPRHEEHHLPKKSPAEEKERAGQVNLKEGTIQDAGAST